VNKPTQGRLSGIEGAAIVLLFLSSGVSCIVFGDGWVEAFGSAVVGCSLGNESLVCRGNHHSDVRPPRPVR